jgi:hypothetical protein
LENRSKFVIRGHYGFFTLSTKTGPWILICITTGLFGN